MTKTDMVVSLLITARDAIEDCIDELVPPPREEEIESATSEAPPKRGVAERLTKQRATVSQKVR